MHRKSLFAAFAALALVAGLTAPSARADTLPLEGGPISFDGTQFSLMGGDSYDPSTYAELFTFDLDMTLQPGAVVTPDNYGDTDTTGVFDGTYTIYVNNAAVSTGTATADGEFYSDGVFSSPPVFTNGVLTQTSGTGLDIYPGVKQFDFAADTGVDGPFLSGTFSPAAAVPLPASAGMGLALLAVMGPLVHRRRRVA